MAMFFDEINNILRFDVPNSEAAIEAQHCGIKDRTVGQYYMSDRYEFCNDFLSNLEGEYYIDLVLSVRNAKTIVNKLIDLNYKKAFKQGLIPQQTVIEAMTWVINNGEYFYKMKSPTINDKKKYLKLDNEDEMVLSLKTLIIGDLCSLYIKKIGKNGFVFYLDKNPKFDELLKQNEVLKWME